MNHGETQKKTRIEFENELFLEALAQSGHAKLKVRGSSMLPCIFQGDIVALESIAMAERGKISLGEVVLVVRENIFYVHRVVGRAVCPRRFLTKGDSLLCADGWVFPREIVARVRFLTTAAGVEFQLGHRFLTLRDRLRLRFALGRRSGFWILDFGF